MTNEIFSVPAGSPNGDPALKDPKATYILRKLVHTMQGPFQETLPRLEGLKRVFESPNVPTERKNNIYVISTNQASLQDAFTTRPVGTIGW